MRDIKFRAWDREFERWCKFSFQFLANGEANPLLPRLDSWCEYTGLKDKNGKEIYEGDIVSWESDYGDEGVSKVIWGDGTSDNSYPAFDLDPSSDEEINSLCSLTIAGTIEVIGNIYENPELLEGPK